ncbi:dihydroxyacetone kinase subunit DhaK [Enterococcus sp. AZ103]|uniref:dihydroxyacetone kinase subunit DhaK n=1 Tax=Enterococcus sp. AZ103 TaxID=2774628 RepID=UPI003F245196
MLNKLRNRHVLIDLSEDIIKKELLGIIKTRPDYYQLVDDDFGYGLMLKDRPLKKVGVIASGGGGLGRLFPAVVHQDLADAVSAGAMDTAPNYLTIYNLAKKIDTGQGVILLTNNYSGDVMNNEMAVEMLEADGIDATIVKVTDNFFSSKEKNKRSGLAGILTLIKIAQQAAKKALSLKEVTEIVEQANQNLTSVTVMATDEGKLMYGKGLADEPASFNSEFKGEAALVKELSDFVLNQLANGTSKKVCIQLNTMIFTSYIEGNILLNGIVDYFSQQGYEVVLANVGSYYDMFNYTGLILTVLSVDESTQEFIQPVTNYDYTI